MAEQEKERPHEIVIIRRGGHGDHDDHHGGVWKIAFADFMTAMMAFFLVLWIVNSSSKETRSSIALYFNPVQLTHSTAARKGLQDPKKLDSDASHTTQPQEPDFKKSEEKEGSATPPQDDKGQKPTSETEKPPTNPKESRATVDDKKKPPAKPEATGAAQGMLKQAAADESALFRDPYAILSEIAASREEGGLKKEARDRQPEAAVGQPGLDAPEKFRDPFEPVLPVLRRQALDTTSANQIANTPDITAQPPASVAGEGRVPVNAEAPPPAKETAGASEVAGESGEQAAKLKAMIDQVLREEGGVKKAPRIELKTTLEGTLISLTDDLDFGMFKIGSAEPDPKTVRVMAKIGTILKSVPGPVVVRGHTDARAYRNASGDNWRLSSSRAQMAFYMLVRGGLDEKRFDRVEGHADRHLKNAAAPLAAENRRIEILIQKDKT